MSPSEIWDEWGKMPHVVLRVAMPVTRYEPMEKGTSEMPVGCFRTVSITHCGQHSSPNHDYPSDRYRASRNESLKNRVEQHAADQWLGLRPS